MTGRSMRLRKRSFWMALAILIAAGLLGPFVGNAAFAQIFTEEEKPKPKTKAKPTPSPKPKAKQRPEQHEPQPIIQTRYAEPSEYCEAVVNADRPSAGYIGAAVPPWIADAAFQGAENVRPEDRAAIREGRLPSKSIIAWRCGNKKVLVCYDINGMQDCGKIGQSASPSPNLRKYCRINTGFAPAGVQGYSFPVWECKNGKPVRNRFVLLDARGFISLAWKDASDWSPKSAVGAVPGIFLGKWRVNADGKGLLSASYLVGFEISGGSIGSASGKADYFIAGMRGTREFACTSSLILKSASPTALEFEERIDNR